MKTGLLWHDSGTGRDLAEKVTQAAERYRQKFGVQPNRCFVHPSMVSSNGTLAVGGVVILPLPSMLKHHFWVGVEEGEPDDPKDG